MSGYGVPTVKVAGVWQATRAAAVTLMAILFGYGVPTVKVAGVWQATRAAAVTLMAILFAAPANIVCAEQPLGPVSQVPEMRADEITRILHAAKPGDRPDLSGKFLAYLDLA